MTPAAIALARRAVACRAWKWMPGMRVHEPWCDSWIRIVDDGPTENGQLGTATIKRALTRWPMYGERAKDAMLPDLDDPATLGVLLALVREAWSDPMITVSVSSWAGWEAWTAARKGPIGRGDSEAGALVAALEAAPAAG